MYLAIGIIIFICQVIKEQYDNSKYEERKAQREKEIKAHGGMTFEETLAKIMEHNEQYNKNYNKDFNNLL